MHDKNNKKKGKGLLRCGVGLIYLSRTNIKVIKWHVNSAD